jgi:geranylgeranyl diphosphate synthase type I
MVRTATPEPLERHRELIATAMRAAVGRLAPPVEKAVSFHLGWQDADGCSLDGDAAIDLREVAMSVTRDS